MTIKAVEKIEGSDLFALPSNPTALAALADFAGKHFGYSGSTPRNAPERINLWRAVNTELAVLKALGSEGDDDLARLEKALGIDGTALAENPDPADVARVSNSVRSKARAQCEALLATGYQP
ncbi:hypothetical protein NO932_08665 [Pelagibacterium sp. 26DY04]|uniref:hypothetical protein n=1 Tax=Pelagibacterium sp. 26DY04 TaxID=2967130 RepID=UPI00281556FD|nr:hypothetical protein [Pelagibacterium sp. 26DY04]WMT88661.1 hypothetical protein NO932_08665 [Pelagibacterium sp. 26DY04]